MNRLVSLALFVCVAAAGLNAVAADSSADEQAILTIEHEWNEALKTKNKAFFEKYLSDDFTYIDQNGVLKSGRGTFIDDVMKLPKFVEVTGTDEKIKVHGTTGVATGLLTVKDSSGVSSTTRYMDVYAKGADGWKAVASQETTPKE